MRTVCIGGGVGCGWEAGDEGEGDGDAGNWCLVVDTARNGRQITVENHIKLGLKGLSCV